VSLKVIQHKKFSDPEVGFAFTRFTNLTSLHHPHDLLTTPPSSQPSPTLKSWCLSHQGYISSLSPPYRNSKSSNSVVQNRLSLLFIPTKPLGQTLKLSCSGLFEIDNCWTTLKKLVLTDNPTDFHFDCMPRSLASLMLPWLILNEVFSVLSNLRRLQTVPRDTTL
jgi:hypothetical protein